MYEEEQVSQHLLFLVHIILSTVTKYTWVVSNRWNAWERCLSDGTNRCYWLNGGTV